MRHKITLRQAKVTSNGFTYTTHRLTGTLPTGERIRKQYADRAEAVQELSRLNVLAANSGDVRAVVTRLRNDQVAEAEAAFHRLGDHSLTSAVDWFLEHYRAPVSVMALGPAIESFLAFKKPHVCALVSRDYKRELAALSAAFAGRNVSDIARPDIQTYLERRSLGKKAWNNTRGLLNAFFVFAADDDRRWCASNPVTKIPKFDVARGVPRVESAENIAALFEYLEKGNGEEQHPRRMIPYFALATFAGMRPSMPGGEIWKVGKLQDTAKVVDTTLGVIRLAPELTKTNDLRQITIQPNLAAWLERYPLSDFPIITPWMNVQLTKIRKRFGLTDDVLRHTFISMHAARFKSLGTTALESGNSERIIKKHYYNCVTEAEAARFWSICPASAERRAADMNSGGT